MNDYEIVQITEKHIPSYHEALDRVAREKKYLSFFEAPSLEASREFVLENIHGDWPHVVAIHKAKVIGWCDISSLHRPIFNHCGVLGVGVIPEYRGQGVGRLLVLQALEKAKDRGLTRIELSVREANVIAINLYTKIGFQKEGLHRNAVCIDGHYEHHVSMALLFSN